MPLEDKKSTSDQSSAQATSQEGPNLEQVNSLIKELNSQAELGRELMKDQQFQDFLRLRQAGKEVQIVEKSQSSTDLEQSTQTPTNPLDELLAAAEEFRAEDKESKNLDDLSNADLLKLVSGQVQKSLQSTVQGLLKPISDQVNGLIQLREQEHSDQFKNTINTEIQQVAEKHSDLKDYKADMIAVQKTITEQGRLPIEDLYLLTKVKKIGLPIEQPDSEFPLNFGGYSQKPVEPEKVRHGRRGMDAIIQDGLDNLGIGV